VDDDVPEALFNELALTVLQQSTLCPLPLAVQPVHWAHEQVCSLQGEGFNGSAEARLCDGCSQEQHQHRLQLPKAIARGQVGQPSSNPSFPVVES
jgi:hypothetical protein